MTKFDDILAQSVLIGDGAMGSMLARSLMHESPLAIARGILEANLSHPELVHSIHLSYISAGARCIETNTFGASRARLDRLGLGDSTRQVISGAVKIAREAREASGQAVWIAGSISPLDTAWMLDTNPSPEHIRHQFIEQTETLLERGADFVLLETFSRLDELLLAIEAVRQVSRSTALVAQMTFDEHGVLATGEDAETAAERVSEQAQVQALGVNCSLGPQASLAILESLATGTTLPLSIMPNAGFAQRLGGRVLYPDMSPSYYENFATGALDLGARLIGGCCGTTPEQISVIAKAVAHATPSPETRPKLHSIPHPQPEAEIAVGVSSKPSILMTKLRAGDFVRTLQIDPQRGPSDALNREVVEAVRDSGLVDVIDINTSGGSARQDSLQIAAGIERLGVETLPHITPRDASVQGVLAQVLGSFDWGGVRNVLVIIGDPPKGDLYAEAKGVYQVDSIGLVRALDRIRAGRRVKDRVTLQPFDLGLGVALNQHSPDVESELERLEKKIEAGADFVMTQPFFDIADWEDFQKRLEGRFDVPIILGIWPLISAKQARRVNENVAGVEIPERVCQKLERAGANEREVGFELASELVTQLERGGTAAGVYVVAPFKQPKQGLEVFARAASRA